MVVGIFRFVPLSEGGQTGVGQFGRDELIGGVCDAV